MLVDDPSDQEEQASHYERNLHTLLEELNMAVCSLVDLTHVVDGANDPKDWPSDECVKSMLF